MYETVTLPERQRGASQRQCSDVEEGIDIEGGGADVIVEIAIT